MTFTSPVTDLIRRRHSCRTYQLQPIPTETRKTFADFLGASVPGPFGTRARFQLVAATETDRASLKGLGTYGFITNPTGFIVGAVEEGPKALEDFGYLLERAVLRATDLGLGTCWLGGTVSKSRFSKTIGMTSRELMPAVVSTGLPLGAPSGDRMRRRAGSDARLPHESLFFESSFETPLAKAAAGSFTEVLEAVRWAPSASNKQPWRLVRTESGWHFYLQRTKGYGKGTLLFTVMRLADLQRVDLGIAMCHFELTATELGLEGAWTLEQPPIQSPGREYVATLRAA